MENEKQDDSSPRGLTKACIRNQNGSDSPKAKLVKSADTLSMHGTSYPKCGREVPLRD